MRKDEVSGFWALQLEQWLSTGMLFEMKRAALSPR